MPDKTATHTLTENRNFLCLASSFARQWLTRFAVLHIVTIYVPWPISLVSLLIYWISIGYGMQNYGWNVYIGSNGRDHHLSGGIGQKEGNWSVNKICEPCHAKTGVTGVYCSSNWSLYKDSGFSVRAGGGWIMPPVEVWCAGCDVSQILGLAKNMCFR